MIQKLSNDDEDIQFIATFAMIDSVIQTLAPLKTDSDQFE